MIADVQPSLEMSQVGDRVVVEAHVRADAPRPLQWRLTVQSAGASGRSRVSQAGRADGSDQAPVARATVNSAGEAVLQVFEDGRMVAEITRPISSRAD